MRRKEVGGRWKVLPGASPGLFKEHTWYFKWVSGMLLDDTRHQALLVQIKFDDKVLIQAQPS